MKSSTGQLEASRKSGRSVARVKEYRADVDASLSLALMTGSVESIRHLDEGSAVALQAILRHGNVLGTWKTPREWGARKATQQEFSIRQRIIDLMPPHLRQNILDAQSAAASVNSVVESITTLPSKPRLLQIVDDAVLTASRYMLLCRMGPAGMGARAQKHPLDPTTVRQIGYEALPPVLAIAVAKRIAASASLRGILIDDEHRFFSLVQRSDLVSLSSHSLGIAVKELHRMRVLGEQGLWDDVPVLDAPLVKSTPVAGPATTPAPENLTDEYQPLPDDYVAEMGRKSLWLIQDLAPNLLTIAAAIPEVWAGSDNGKMTLKSVARIRRNRLKRYLADFVWRDSQGQVIESPPFQLRLSGAGGQALPPSRQIGAASEEESAGTASWPPRGVAHIKGLMATLQRAHLFVVLLSNGARQGEVLDMTRNCVVYRRNGLPFAKGRTYKLVERHDGKERDWVLPDVAMKAIEQQVRLVALAEAMDASEQRQVADAAPAEDSAATHLWASLGSVGAVDPTLSLTRINESLLLFADTLCMDRKPNGKNLHPHRFRKTIARLCALAITQSPKVLKDVFGHRGIEMTLYYIMADKALAVDIETVARELRVMKAKEVVEDMVAAEEALADGVRGLPMAGYGGPAAVFMEKAVQTHRVRVYRRGELWGANSALELAQILTMQGTAGEYVRPGVICTKFVGEAGPCNRSKGKPDPSNCQADCLHRLEEAFLRSDVDRVIGELVRDYGKTVEQSDLLTQASLGEQIRQQVIRFADLREKWLQHPTVLEVFAEVVE